VRQPERDPMWEWTDERVDTFVDGELSPEEMVQFEEALAVGVGNEDVLLARRIRNGLHALPQPVLRPEVSRFILEQVRADVRVSRRGWLRQLVEREWASLFQPALTMAVLLMIVVSAVLVGRPPMKQENISQAEVEQALAEARWALGYISHVSKETGSSVRSEVLEAHVVRPVRHALGAALNEQSETELR
jgi:hypothetical protein